ncbi:MUTS family DNA-binding domain protein [Megavirus baoshan]|uniref:MUTS family DNA-binding domain protein n=1 Tax=Megavirus baoshan TaxID=2496520 RepID=A0A3S8UY35_9VIRU|nr:MUTS family DNA-binding domain protein [Megavirus baoshan]YP_010789312.1 MUTS family DNA-binding domain protein [Megavirus baoshan]AZL89711.1 MUTS family DNA-binding domain protein [Megavirus baoshan]UFX99933.1 MUTS family DNA-binding domain protein [Megavirus baoshan]
MFVRHNGKSWIKSSDKSCKYDKIIIKSDYVEKNVFPKKSKKDNDSDDEDNDSDDEDNDSDNEDNDSDNENNDDDSEEEDNEITIAPGIIKLTKKEKMKDNSGNIIEIEVRGTRDHDNCYFKVYDVARGFGMKQLNNIIIKSNSYVENIHYRYLYLKKTAGKGYCKKLYLTFVGMEKVINCSRSIHIQNAMSARKWLSQFCVSVKFNGLVLDSSKSSVSNIGYTYCITSDKIDADKIGYWKGMKKDLISRYKTYYGDTVKIFSVKTMYPELLEKKCHQHFKKYKLSHELYDKSKTDEYKLFLKENKMTPTEQDIYEDQQMTEIDVKTLFTAHLGTQDQKNELSSKLMGISANIVKEVFSTTSSTLPTIYLFSIGRVKDLRATLKIDKKYHDDDIVCKGGETIDLTRRINEHNTTYGKLPGAILCLKWHNYIDPQYTSKAETELFMLLDKLGHKMDHPKYNELIIFPKDKKAGNFIIDQFKNVSNKYLGHVKVLVDKIKELENEISELKYKNEINELKYKNIILEKDLEIAGLKKRVRNK